MKEFDYEKAKAVGRASRMEQEAKELLVCWVDQQTLCKMLGVCVHTLRKYRRSWGISYRKIGRKTFYDLNQIKHYLHSKTEGDK